MTLSPLMLVGAAAAGSAAIRGVERVAEQAGTFAKLLASRLGPKTASEPAPDDAVPATTDLRSAAEQTQAEFGDLLQQRLADLGLTTTLRFQLVDDGRGGIRVAGDHPQRSRIEQAINSDPQLLSTFHYLSATYSLLAAAERHGELTERYLGDPVLGAAEITRFAEDEEQPFTITVNGDEITADVGGRANS